MNLMINNYCNLCCNYCFAQEEMNKHKRQDITIEDFCKYLNFLRRELKYGNYFIGSRVRLMGGEPTYSPLLEQYIDMVIDYGCFESILLFTNFTFDKKVAEMLKEKSKFIDILLLANINDINCLSPTDKEKMLYNFEYLMPTLRDNFTLSCNLFTANQKIDFWEEIIKKYNILNIRCSIVVPNKRIPKNFDVKEYFHQFQPLLLNMAQLVKKYKVNLRFDCSIFPICALDDWAVIELLKINPSFFKEFTCDRPVFDIMPNLDIRGCFGCPDTTIKNLQDFSSYQELHDFYKKDREKVELKLARKECLNCSRYQTTGVSCVCLGYRTIDKDKIYELND